MAQQGVQLDQETLCCSICLDLLKDPVTVPCGHNYCSRCINGYWNQDDQRGRFSCPQCSQTFIPRPVLKKNTMLAEVVESLKKTELQSIPPEHCYAGPGDVACDFCTGRKLKAVKTCLQCRVSYCDAHLQPHYQSPAFKNHKLVNTSTLQENICSLHDEVRKIFCRTDKQCICYLCCMEEHKGHDTISAAAERTERQKELCTNQQNIQQRVKETEEDVKVLHQELESINHCADREVEDSDTVFTDLISSIDKRRSELRELIRDQQKHEVSRAEEQRKHVEQRGTELRRRHAELEQLSHTEDHIHFLNSYTSLSKISESTHPVSSHVRPVRYFENVTVAVSKMRDKLVDILKEEGTNVLESVNRVDVLLPTPEPKTRAEFLQKIKREDILKIKIIKRVFVVILLFLITLTHPIKSSVHTQGTHREQLGKQYLAQGHLNTNPGGAGDQTGKLSTPIEPKTRAETHPIKSSVHTQGTHGEQLGDQYLAQGQLNTNPGGVGDQTGKLSTPTEPETRAEFLQYSCPITLDPNTAHQEMSLSKENRKVTMMDQQQVYPPHPERFTDWKQVLSREGLTGRCYWEVEWSTFVSIAVSYKDISRTGGDVDSGFGYNDKSWSLLCGNKGCFFNIVKGTNIPGPVSSRVGVYLDHSAGTLSFYMVVSDTMTVLHRVQTTFTQPLYAGLGSFVVGSTAELCVLK